MGVNTFNNGINKQEYLFKLLPDFGVFDIAERYFIDNNISEKIDKLFFYDPAQENGLIERVQFRRFIVKSNGSITIKKYNTETEINDNNEKIVYHSFSIESDNYVIIIDEQNLAGPFTVFQSGGDYLIGVCF